MAFFVIISLVIEMEEHLVRGHLGGFYISSLDPEFIESYCETCGDYDQIEASWNSEDENGKIEALSEYFSRESISSKEQLDNLIGECSYEDDSNIESIENVIDEIIFNNESNTEIIEYLYEDRDLSKDEHDELIKRNNMDLKKQLIFIKDNLNNYVDSNKDIKKINKTLSLSLNENKQN